MTYPIRQYQVERHQIHYDATSYKKKNVDKSIIRSKKIFCRPPTFSLRKEMKNNLNKNNSV